MLINAYYERAYNVTHGIEDEVRPIYKRWQRDSETARQILNAHLDCRYGDANRETIDLFIADEPTTRWLVFIHGGYWRVTEKSLYSFIAASFVKAGYNVAIPEYDLCPAVTLLTLIEQCRRAIAWLTKNASEYSPGCDEIVLSGHSAGGHLTGMMFATDWQTYDVNPDIFIGGIALSGLFDLDPLIQTEKNTAIKLTLDEAVALSPARLTPQINAPLVLVAGARESSEFHRQNHVLHGAPGWDRITSAPLSLANIQHFDILDAFMDINSDMWQTLDKLQS
ncbi:MAG: alpha/beta hydrolase [Aggregatilineales bacterium]